MTKEKILIMCEVDIKNKCYEDIDTILHSLQEIKRCWIDEWSKDWDRMELQFGHSNIGSLILQVYVFRTLCCDERILETEKEIERLSNAQGNMEKALHLKRMKLQDLRNLKQRSQNGKSK